MENTDDNTNANYRDEVLAAMKQIEEEEKRILGWQGRLDLSSKEFDEAEAQLDPDVASLLDSAEDPALVKKLWWNAQSSIIRNTLPGKSRQFALYEKGIFLKKSSKTTDSKFTFKHPAQTVYDIVDSWIRENGDPIELGMALWDLNERNNFHSTKKQLNFDGGLKEPLPEKSPKKAKAKATPTTKLKASRSTKKRPSETDE